MLTKSFRNIEIRDIQESDSIDELTQLIRTAYQSLADLGLFFWGTWQNEENTRERIEASHSTLVGIQNGKLVATLSLYAPNSSYKCEHYQTAWYFGQFAVHPDLQRTGLGSHLLGMIEDRAMSNGARCIALDTAEPATHLIEFYRKHNYSFIQHQQWEKVNYRSVVMSKELSSAIKTSPNNIRT